MAREPQNMMRYAGLASQWVVILGVAVWGGIKLDGQLKWQVPLFTILFPVAALTLSLWQLIRELNQPKK